MRDRRNYTDQENMLQGGAGCSIVKLASQDLIRCLKIAAAWMKVLIVYNKIKQKEEKHQIPLTTIVCKSKL